MNMPTDNLTPDELRLLQALADQAPPAPTAFAIRARLASRNRQRRMWVASSAAAAAVMVAVSVFWVLAGWPTPGTAPPIVDDGTDEPDQTDEPNESDGSNDNAAPAPDVIADDDPSPVPPQPERRIRPIAADESVTGACLQMASWLHSMGATRAVITKWPGEGISISIAGSAVPPLPELTADLDVLLLHFDHVEVELSLHGIKCSLTQLH